MKNRHIAFPVSLKAQLTEYAYQQRTNPSALVRRIVEIYAEQGLSALETRDLGIGVQLKDKLSFMIPIEAWNMAQDRAVVDRTNVPVVIRRRIAKMCDGVVLPE